MEAPTRKRQRKSRLHSTSTQQLNDLIKQRANAAQVSLLSRSEVQEQAPLTAAQQRLWYAWKVAPHDKAYNLAGSLYFDGQLDAELVKRSFDVLQARHGALQIQFCETEAGVYQQQNPQLNFEFSVVSMAQANANQPADKLSHAMRPFDLLSEPLLRVVLVNHDNRCELLIVMHHIITDGTSMQILFDEFVDVYQAYTLGKAPATQKQVDFIDYACWQATQDNSTKLAQQKRNWVAQLPTQIEAITLPAAESARRLETYTMATHSATLTENIVQAVSSTAERFGTTPYLVMLTIFQMTLQRFCGQRDVLVGVPVANRHIAETLGVIGFFVNTQVSALRVTEHDSFSTLIAQAKQHHHFAQSNQDLPFEQLIDALAVERVNGTHPIFQVMFNYLRRDKQRAKQLRDATLSHAQAHRFTMPFDLHLDVIDVQNEGVQCHFYYAEELYQAPFIAQFQRAFFTALNHLTSCSTTPITQASLWQSDTASRLPIGESTQPGADLLAQLQYYGEQQPEQVAAVGKSGVLTYGELVQRSDKVAAILQSKGILAQRRVGLRMSRDITALVSIFGVLKAGMTYVPIDASLPESRQHYLIENSEVALVISDLETTLAIQCEQVPYQQLMAQTPAPLTPPLRHSKQLAYVLYTSGSTGLPKGVAVTFAGLNNYLADASERYMATCSRAVVSSTLSFDATITSLLVPIYAGKRVDMIAQDDGLLEQVAECIQQATDNTLFKLTPAHLDGLLSLGRHITSSLHHCFVIGGDKLMSGTVAKLQRHLINSRFINEYGPTETVVGCSAFLVTPQSCAAHTVQPISNALNNTALFVLDEYLNHCPANAVGELYIAGAGLAQGYLGRADLTAERFIANPFSDDGSRLYRTGDIVRYEADGTLLYLGRSDNQVKIRGYRIELAEIEAQLCTLPNVDEAVAIVEEGTTHSRIIGYVVASEVDVPAALSHLEKHLPQYMLPAHIIALDSIPLTVNGKVDKTALPKASLQLTRDYIAPEGEMEQLIARLWQAQLGLEQISRHDSFFKLGGDSIIALRFIAALGKALGYAVTLKTLLLNPVLEQFADAINQPQSAILPLEKRPQNIPALASPGQRSLWVAHQLALNKGEAMSYNMFGGVDLHGELDVTKLQLALDKLVEQQSALRTWFAEVDGEIRLNAAAHTRIVIEEFDFSALDDEAKAKALAHQQQQLSLHQFDLAAPPLVKVNAVWLAPKHLRLLVNMHHIISDGWSIAIFIESLSNLYGGSHQEKDAELTFEYDDFAHWQQQRLQSEEAKTQQSYWRNTLRDAPTLSLFPAHKPLSGQSSDVGAELSLVFSEAQSQQLRQFAQSQHVSLNSVMMTAYLLFLQYVTKQQDLVVGTDLAGREVPELEKIIGYFVKVLPVRTQLSKTTSMANAVKTVHHTLAATMEHQLLSLDEIIKQVNPPRDQFNAPILQQLFVMQNAPKASWQAQGVSFTPAVIDLPKYSKFANALFVTPNDEIECTWLYRKALYDGSAMRVWLQQWRTLLLSLIAQPDTAISEHYRTLSAVSGHKPKSNKFAKFKAK